LNNIINMKREIIKLIFAIASLIFFMGSFTTIYSQNIGITLSGVAPNPSAALDVSSTEQGVLIPRLTDAERQALKDPASGLMIYNTTSNEINFYDGTGWQRIPGSSVSVASGTGTGPGNGIAINVSNNPPDPSALLDVSATDKGLLIPRTTQGAVTAVTGLIIYNTTTNSINYYNGTSWQVPCTALIDNNKGVGAVVTGAAINTSGAAPDASAILDIASASKGILIPRMTSAQRDAIKTPAQGLMVYNNTNNKIENWTGSAWFEWGSTAPAAPGTITGSSSVCQNSSGNVYSISAVTGATSYTWSVPAGATITAGQGTTSITVTFGTNSGNITVTASNSCGTSAATTLAITVNTAVPAQPSVITGTSPVCINTNGVSYSVTNVAGVTYTWTYSGTGFTVASGQGTNSITADFSASATSGTLTVTPGNACGNGTARTYAITVQTAVPAQPSVITGTTPVCRNDNGVSYSVTNVAGVTYTWTYSGAGFTVASGQGTNSITADFSASATSGTLTVTPSNACGNGPARTYAITVNTAVPAQPSVITGTTPVCASTNGVSYSVTNVAGVTYTWTYSGTGFTVASGQGTNSITANFSASATSGTLTVTPSNACGNGTARTYAITVNSVTASNPGNINNMCAGEQASATFNTTFNAGYTYQWQISTNGGSTWNNLSNTTPYSGVTTSTLTINYPGKSLDGYEYRCVVTATATGCSKITNSGTLNISSGCFIDCSDAGSWYVPFDWNSSSNSIELWGKGGDGADGVAGTRGGGGGGGGAYAKITNVTLTPSTTIVTQVPCGNTATTTAFVRNNSGTIVVQAASGSNASGATGGAGGTAASSIGSTKYSGGNGGSVVSNGGGGGGGGGAGPNGAGKNGGSTQANSGGGGGGGANGGSSTAGANSTSSTGGNGGTGGSGSPGGAGSSTGSGTGSGAGNGDAGSGGGAGQVTGTCTGGSGSLNCTGAGGGGGGGTRTNTGSDLSTAGGDHWATCTGSGGGGGGYSSDNGGRAGKGSDAIIRITY
jgi:hypothetical protein